MKFSIVAGTETERKFSHNCTHTRYRAHISGRGGVGQKLGRVSLQDSLSRGIEVKFMANDIADYLIKIISWYVKWHFIVITVNAQAVCVAQCIIEADSSEGERELATTPMQIIRTHKICICDSLFKYKYSGMHCMCLLTETDRHTHTHSLT